MSSGARIALIAAAVAVVAVAFAVARPGDDDGGGAGSDGPAAGDVDTQPTATAPSAPEPPPDAPTPPRRLDIQLEDHAPVEGVRSLRVEQGERVRLVVTSDAADSIHIHGYDIERELTPGRQLRVTFRATIEGVFEIESHEAEHAGADPLVARLVVEPS